MMKRRVLSSGAVMAPVPAVMVSCGREGETPNIITIAWTGIVNSNPPMTYISVRKERFSHDIIADTKEFVINLTTEELAFATDWCGVKSGRDFDKFREQKLTPVTSEKVSCPSIGESPLSIECRVTEVKELGSHDMFLAEIVSMTAQEELMDENGELHLEKAGLMAYSHGHYFPVSSREIGRFGYSVMKPKTRKKYEAAKRARRRRGSRIRAGKR
ncbi:MAG: flavin reductase family protein [Firmicutes bacterium]|nr:flavin reductase family protein [Bacillota bacterium]MDD7131003.1 flavin reductase family protein [Bacillota bacterium]